MRFMMLMIPDVYRSATPPDFAPPEDALAEMGKFNEEMHKAGIMLAADGLRPPNEAVRVSFAGGKPKVTDGPFAEVREVLGGYWMIDVKSKEEAVEWARRCPAGPGDVIEIRRVQELEDFAPSEAIERHMRLRAERTAKS